MHTAQQTANRLNKSKQTVLVAAREGRIVPKPKKLAGKNAQWIFAANARIIERKKVLLDTRNG
jgi:hypothetical protein